MDIQAARPRSARRRGQSLKPADTWPKIPADPIGKATDRITCKLNCGIVDRDVPPLQQLRDTIDDLKTEIITGKFQLTSLIDVLHGKNGARAALHRAFAERRAWTACCLRAAQAAGTIAPDKDCDLLAAFFWIGWDGAILRAGLERSVAPLDLFA